MKKLRHSSINGQAVPILEARMQDHNPQRKLWEDSVSEDKILPQLPAMQEVCICCIIPLDGADWVPLCSCPALPLTFGAVYSPEAIGIKDLYIPMSTGQLLPPTLVQGV